LAWLAAEGELYAEASPVERITRERARRYLAWLRSALAPGTVATMMTRLKEAVRIMAPEAEIGWLRAGAARLHRMAVPVRNKLPRLVEVDRLVTAGFAVMAQAEAASLAPLHTYLAVHRPTLLVTPETPALWLGRNGPLTVSGITQVIRAVSERELGMALNPHLFRDCAATMVATQDPEHARIIASILGHARQETSERYYNHAQSMAAGRAYQEIVHRQRGSRGRRSSASRTGAGS
jgi:hypothetical protein